MFVVWSVVVRDQPYETEEGEVAGDDDDAKPARAVPTVLRLFSHDALDVEEK